jgi:hypothetical protein
MEHKPNYYSILTADVRYSDKLSPFDKLLYSDITALTNKNGYCNATNKYFSKVFNKSIRAISRSISVLSDNNFITTSLKRDDNNEIVERKIYLNQTVSIGIAKNDDTPIDKNDDTPIDKNGQYNNIKSNSIKKNNNIYVYFEDLWNQYPKKEGKQKAEEYFKRSVKTQTDLDNIFKAIENYKLKIEKEGIGQNIGQRTQSNMNALDEFLNSQNKSTSQGLLNG